MTAETKCKQCGGSVPTKGKFCPFCGSAVPVPETEFDFKKFELEHKEAVRQQIAKEKSIQETKSNKGIAIYFICFALFILVVALAVIIPRNAEDNRLNQTVAKVQQLIINGDLDQAIVEVETIRVEKDGLFDSRFSKWENTRNDLKKLIEQKRRESK